MTPKQLKQLRVLSAELHKDTYELRRAANEPDFAAMKQAAIKLKVKASVINNLCERADVK